MIDTTKLEKAFNELEQASAWFVTGDIDPKEFAYVRTEFASTALVEFQAIFRELKIYGNQAIIDDLWLTKLNELAKDITAGKLLLQFAVEEITRLREEVASLKNKFGG